MSFSRILVVRPDRIGDVVLSTPVARGLKRSIPTAHVTFLVRASVTPLLRHHPDIDAVAEIPDRWSELVSLIRKGEFDVAVNLQSDPRIALAELVAGVPKRVGPLSKPHSFLLYNLGVRQRRSRVEKHEADYNLDLLLRLGVKPVESDRFTRVVADPQAVERAQIWLQDRKLSRFVAIHPGMGGSALNPSAEWYGRLVNEMESRGVRVVVTGGTLDRERIGELRNYAPRSIYWESREGENIQELAGVLSQATAVIAPSTGPLHLAVALGRPVIGIYSHIRVQCSMRWGPYPESAGTVVTPPDGATDSGCMDRINISSLVSQVYEIVKGSEP